ncbi:hypothetical protein VT99_10155 [Candidatus Electrothrix marina]|uniref:Uncharacterized protein n=1 Tax=Candidatus Electrothrix marina TaxID=1859130 RepID=A0A3S3R3E6_9BACT|nr:hypothetical protein VT99_10155 [Candidatus Electrothrix marina]
MSAVDVGTAFNSYRDVVKVGFARFFLLFLQERCPALVISSIL